MKNSKILILGKGRMGQAISHYLKKFKATKKVAFFSNEREIKNSQLLIGALPSKVGERSLRLALKYKKDLIDLSDLEVEFYLKKKREINKKKIFVLPGAGFCPGLINFILGKEISNQKEILEIEVKVGTLSKRPFFFPFLWCFEDLILEHKFPSFQVISGKKKKFLPFEGYQREKFYGILAESYFGQSGFENLMKNSKIKNFKFKIVRPLGFFYFFQFLKEMGFLEKKNLEKTKKILESQREDNLTLAEIKILTKKRKIFWQIKSFSKKKEKFNSMQKITGIFPAILAKFLFEGKIQKKGFLLPEDIAKDQKIFFNILRELKKHSTVSINRES